MKTRFVLLLSPLLLFFSSCGDGVTTPHVTMFMTSLTTGGSFTTRQLADNLCQVEWNFRSDSLSKVSKRENTHAMVSYSTGNDMISTMAQNFQLPDNLPVYVGSVKINNSWNELLQSGPRVQLSSIAAFPKSKLLDRV